MRPATQTRGDEARTWTKPNFIVGPTNPDLLLEEVGVGKVGELPAADAGLLAPHIEGHPQTVYAAASGVGLGGRYGVFPRGEQQVAVEWVRQESEPQPGEPECNTHRYLFGLTQAGGCLGYEVTEPEASATTGTGRGAGRMSGGLTSPGRTG